MREISALLDAPFLLRRIEAAHPGVTLWLLDVSPATQRPSRLLEVLSPEEQARAARFRSAEDRLRFGLTRAVLRHILGEATGQAPDGLVFATGPWGKPALAGTDGPYFNVSHSGSRALIGISHFRPIGVDIEWTRAISDLLGLAEAFFSRREYHALAELSETERNRAFYAIWTGKEAVLKALGTGLGEGLRDFSVAPTPRGFSVVPESASFAAWLDGISLEKIEVPETYAAGFALGSIASGA